MAWIQRDPSDNFHVSFRFGGRKFKRSLKTKDEREATARLDRLEETIRLVLSGRIDLPNDADLPTFLLSDGKRQGKTTLASVLRLKALFDDFFESVPAGNLNGSTLATMNVHRRQPDQEHAAGALASGTSDSNLTAFLEHLAEEAKKGIATKLSTDVGQAHDETFNKQPEAEDTGTGITKPPRASDVERAKPQEAPPKGNNLVHPLVVVAGGMVPIGFLAGVLALLIWQPWKRETPAPTPPVDGTVTVGEDDPDEWLDLFALINPQQDAVSGEWKVEDGKLKPQQRLYLQRIAFPVAPEGSYRLRIAYAGTESEQRTILLPCGGATVVVDVDIGDDHYSGLVLQ